VASQWEVFENLHRLANAARLEQQALGLAFPGRLGQRSGDL
jgi:hypothetical protein